MSLPTRNLAPAVESESPVASFRRMRDHSTRPLPRPVPPLEKHARSGDASASASVGDSSGSISKAAGREEEDESAQLTGVTQDSVSTTKQAIPKKMKITFMIQPVTITRDLRGNVIKRIEHPRYPEVEKKRATRNVPAPSPVDQVGLSESSTSSTSRGAGSKEVGAKELEGRINSPDVPSSANARTTARPSNTLAPPRGSSAHGSRAGTSDTLPSTFNDSSFFSSASTSASAPSYSTSESSRSVIIGGSKSSSSNRSASRQRSVPSLDDHAPHAWTGSTLSQALQSLQGLVLDLPVDIGTPPLRNFTTVDGTVLKDEEDEVVKYLRRLIGVIGMKEVIGTVFYDAGVKLDLRFEAVEKRVEEEIGKKTSNRSSNAPTPSAFGRPLSSAVIEKRSSTPSSTVQQPPQPLPLPPLYLGKHLDEIAFVLQQENIAEPPSQLIALNSFTSDGGKITEAGAADLETYVKGLIGTLMIIPKLEAVLEEADIDFEHGEQIALAKAEGKGKGKEIYM